MLGHIEKQLLVLVGLLLVGPVQNGFNHLQLLEMQIVQISEGRGHLDASKIVVKLFSVPGNISGVIHLIFKLVRCHILGKKHLLGACVVIELPVPIQVKYTGYGHQHNMMECLQPRVGFLGKQALHKDHVLLITLKRHQA